MSELTSNPAAEKLVETEVVGRTVYVSPSSESAYVEFQSELVSMTNLRAWNTLMENAKQDVIDGYDTEKSLADKELERYKDVLSSDLREIADELYRKSDKVQSLGEL